MESGRSKLFDLARTQFAGFGIKVSPELDLPTMMVQKQASVDALGHGIEFLFHKNKVDRIDRWARLAGPGNVQVRKPCWRLSISKKGISP